MSRKEGNMAETYKNLFEPVRIGKVEIKNRIVMAPLGIDYMTNLDGSPSERAVEYYLERARNGVGLIISGCFKVENEIEKLEEGTPLISERAIGPFGELCDALHSFGVRFFVQLTAGYGRVAVPSTLRGSPVSASAVPNYWNTNVVCRALETEEVEQIILAMGRAAELLHLAGVDGIELHGHEGYLFDQFTTSAWNKRKDKYGGSLENRLRFPIEVLREIRKRCGKAFPVQYRFGMKHYMKDCHSGALPGEKFIETGRDIEEGMRMARMLEDAGFNALHVDAGCYDSWYWPHPPMYQKHGCMIDMAAEAKKVVEIPVIAVGRLDDPEVATKVIEEKKADMVAIGRGLLADPKWPIKVQEGIKADIRPCLACYDGCFAAYRRMKPISCAVNPSAGREKQYQLSRTDTPKEIVVVGGGVAGMEAARVAAIRGHRVTLYEKEENLGGMLIAASVPDFKKELKRLLSWYELQLAKAGVKIRLGKDVSPEFLIEKNPEVVFVATGASPVIPEIKGIENTMVITGVNLLLGKRTVGFRPLIVGGGLVGCEIALWLAGQGKRVTIVEMLPELMASGSFVPHQVRLMIMDLLAANNVTLLTNAKVKEIAEDGFVVIHKDYETTKIKADTVVTAVGLKPNNELFRSLSGSFTRIFVLGDCREPNNIMNAIWDAYEVARAV